MNNLIVILLISFIPSIAYALGELKADAFITINFEYNDNIFFTTAPKTEFITTIIPGINTKIVAGKSYHEIKYKLKLLKYQDIKYKNINHLLNIIGHYELSNKIMLSAEGYFIEDKEETIEEDFYVTRREYLKKKFISRVNFQLKPRLGTDVKYLYEDFDFKKEQKDSKENQIFFDIYYILSKRLRVIGVYQYRNRYFEDLYSLKLSLLGIGIQYELSPRVNSRLILKYEEIATKDKDSNASAFILNISRQLNKKTTSYFTFEQATKFSRTLVNPVKLKIAKINILRELNKKTNINLFISSIHGSWQDTTRRDKLQTITFRFYHQISKSMSFNINYNHLNRKSNIYDKYIKNNIYRFNFQIQ